MQKPVRARSRAITHPDRPPIWADGRQQPPFDLKSFLRVSLANARASTKRGLEAGAERAAAARNTMPRLAAGTQSLCSSAARSLCAETPGFDADTQVIRAVLAGAFPRPAAPTPSRTVSDDDATLAAIRAVLREDQAIHRPAPQPSPKAPHAPGGALARLVATAMVIALLPFGAAAALHSHLSGEDLRLSR
ncbi:hypothetical protein [Neotabrizicola shimadae]|uniref:Uncharacterized protein n=1 Tax=Neotabrizicola shimadae TaxID=2807096 RepID=A0A8G0ZXP6_9RHOB|nr:hypothetical protein [Neotabrizicola shimadae]QYZ71375.1 hypothetical protein JO391_07725 [Neotabrizicola shimadae]